MDPANPRPHSASRRGFLRSVGAGAAVITVLPLAANATPESARDAIAKAFPGKTPVAGRVNITLPEIAENGGTVPLTIAVESPMQADDHVKAVHIFSEGNPSPEVATFYLGPHNGKAELSMRIRLMQTQNVVAVAEMSNGDVYTQGKQVKVTLGGCGG